MTDPKVARINELLEELYRLVNDEPGPEPVEATPANITPIRKDDEVELEGVIGRPELKQVRGKTLFTAGLKVETGETQEWLNIAAWGTTAETASTIRRGAVVRVVGKVKETAFVDSYGVMQSKRELTAKVISPVTHAEPAFSANTLSRERRNGTT